MNMFINKACNGPEFFSFGASAVAACGSGGIRGVVQRIRSRDRCGGAYWGSFCLAANETLFAALMRELEVRCA